MKFQLVQCEAIRFTTKKALANPSCNYNLHNKVCKVPRCQSPARPEMYGTIRASSKENFPQCRPISELKPRSTHAVSSRVCFVLLVSVAENMRGQTAGCPTHPAQTVLPPTTDLPKKLEWEPLTERGKRRPVCFFPAMHYNEVNVEHNILQQHGCSDQIYKAL